MSAFTRNEAPFYVYDLLPKISINSSVNQPTAQCYDEWQQAQAQGWFMRMSEGNFHDAWRNNARTATASNNYDEWYS